MIKLFESTATSFLNNGLGVLQQLKCIEHKKKSLNGWYIECEFPIKYKDKIVQDAILYVDTKEKGGQPFRCNNPKYNDRKITVTANHLVFDSENYILDDVRPTNLSPVAFLNWINKRTDITSPFFVSSNVSGSGTKYFIRKTLLDGFKETEALFGGTFDADGFEVSLKAQVGNDDGFAVAYGKNLQSISVIEDWSAVCTKLLPVGPDGLLLPERYLYTEVQYDKPYTKVIEFDIPTSYEDENGTRIDYSTNELIEFLREKATEYVKDSYIPKINYTVKSDVPQELRIGDTVHVKHPIVSIRTEVQAYSYDVISKRVLTLEFGNYERDVKKVFDAIKESVENANTNASSAISIASKQTELINNLNKNGLVYIDDNEILILDALPKENAQNVWRFGLGGIGFSSNGYEGPFEYAFTQDGKFNADFIKANSITANHLAADVGSSLDLSSNKTIKLTVERVETLEKTVTVTSISSQYGVSTDKTVEPTSWANERPDVTSGQYLWMRDKYIYSDGTIKYDGVRMISAEDGESATVVRIDSSRGTVFKNNTVNTTLSVVVFHGSRMITDIAALRSVYGTGAYLQWSWQRLDEDRFGVISSSDTRIQNDGFSFILTPDDVDTKVTFQCDLIA